MDKNVVNLDEIVDEVNIVTRTSKAGKDYKIIQIKLVDGYELEVFTRERAEVQLIEMLLKEHTTSAKS